MRRDRLIVLAICLIIAFILVNVILSTTKMKPMVFFVLVVICSIAMSEKRGWSYAQLKTDHLLVNH